MKYIAYILFAVLALIMVFIESFFKNTKIKLVTFITILTSYFLLGVFKANSVGIDSVSYSQTYENAKQLTFGLFLKNKRTEIGFYGLIYLFSNIFGVSELFFNILCFLIICLSLFFSFYKHEYKTMFVSIFLFVGFFCMSFSGLRQSIAISISTLAISRCFDETVEKKPIYKLIEYFLLIGISITFHVSSVILLAVPLLSLIFIDEYAIPYLPVFVLLFAPLLFSRSFMLFSFFSSTFSLYSVFDSRLSITLILETVFIVVFYLLYFTGLGSKVREKCGLNDFNYSQKDSNYLMIMYLSCICVAFNTGSTIITRLSMYFYMGSTYFLVKVGSTIKSKKIRVLYNSVIVMMLGIYFVYNTPIYGLVPYAFR